MKKIRILHVAQAAGGVDRYIRMLLKYLDKDKFENVLVCSQDFHKEDYEGLVDAFEQIEMNRAIGASDLNSIREVRRLIKKYNPDIVYMMMCSPDKLRHTAKREMFLLVFLLVEILRMYEEPWKWRRAKDVRLPRYLEKMVE